MLIHRWSRGRGEGGSRPLSLPAPCSTKGWRAGPQLPTQPPTPHTLTHQCCTAMHRPPPTNYQCPNQEHLETHQSRPTRVHYVSLPLPLGASPPHTDPCPLSLVHSHMLCTSLPCEMEDSLLLNICSRMPCRPRPDALAASAPSLRPPSLLPLSTAFSRGSSRGGGRARGGSRPLSLPAPLDPQKLWRPNSPCHRHHTHSSAPATTTTKYQRSTKQSDMSKDNKVLRKHGTRCQRWSNLAA